MAGEGGGPATDLTGADGAPGGREAAGTAVGPAGVAEAADAPGPAAGATARPSPTMAPDRHSLARRLFDDAPCFDFFQAVRLLHRLESGRVRVGRGGPPQAEAVRFRARISLSFPPSS